MWIIDGGGGGGRAAAFLPLPVVSRTRRFLFLPFGLGTVRVWKGVKECALAGSDMSLKLLPDKFHQPSAWSGEAVKFTWSRRLFLLQDALSGNIQDSQGGRIWQVPASIIEVTVHFLLSPMSSSAPSLSFRWFSCRSFPLVPPVTNQIRGDHLVCQAKP